MSRTERYQPIVASLKTGLDASLDCVCLVNPLNEIVYMNLPMKNFLGIRPRELEEGCNFCSVVKLAACKEHCQILDVLRTGTPMRLDEVPAEKRGQKFRISLKIIPFYEGGAAVGTRPLGAVLSLRDSSGEILLQAKYHKTTEMLKERDDRILELEERIRSMQKSLRGARGGGGS